MNVCESKAGQLLVKTTLVASSGDLPVITHNIPVPRILSSRKFHIELVIVSYDCLRMIPINKGSFTSKINWSLSIIRNLYNIQ